MSQGFPTDKEVEDRKLLPLSYNFYADDPKGYNSVITDFIGVLIKGMEDDNRESFNVKELEDMQERFKDKTK